MSPEPEELLPRAIALDLDGTALNPEYEVSPGVTAAVAAARDAGMRVLLTSGRSPSSILRVQEQMGIDGEWFVACQGSIVARRGEFGEWEVLSETRIDPYLALAIEDAATAASLSVGRFCGDRWFAQSRDESIAWQEAITGMSVSGYTTDRLNPEMAPHKMLVGVNSLGSVPELLRFSRGLSTSVTASHSHETLLEITGSGVDKLSAIRILAFQLGLEMQHVAAIGDGENDISLLSGAGMSFAMGNARPDVLAAAKSVTLDNSQDGAALAIYEILETFTRSISGRHE